MRRLARPAIGVAALALVAVGTSCEQQSPRNKAQQSQNQARQPEPQAQQAETKVLQPEPQPQHPESQARQAQNKTQQPEPPQAQQPQTPVQPPEAQAQEAQNKVQQPEPQAQQPQHPMQQPEPQTQQAQNKAQQPEPRQAQPPQNPPPSVNQNSDQTGGQNTADDLSQAKVRRVQQALEQNGFRVGPLDGLLGPMTKRALSQFQRKQGLRQTGMPDEPTLAALGVGGGVSNTGQGPSGGGGMSPNQATEPQPQGR